MKIGFDPFYGRLSLEAESEAEHHQINFVATCIMDGSDRFCNKYPGGIALALAEDTLQATKKNLIPNKTGGGE